MNQPLLECRSVTHRFGSLAVVDGVEIEVRPHRVCALLGPSGCGKSTLLSICAGLIRPSSGSVLVRGRDVTGTTGIASYMQQDDLLFPWRRIIDNVGLPLELQGTGRREARRQAQELFGDFGLEGFEYSWPWQLSGGMRQRAALMRTWMFSHDILLLDEPFGALDAITRRRMQRWLLSLLERLGSAALLVTHDVDEAVTLADEVVVLSPRPARVVERVTVDRSAHTVDAQSYQHAAFIDARTRLLTALDEGYEGDGP